MGLSLKGNQMKSLEKVYIEEILKRLSQIAEKDLTEHQKYFLNLLPKDQYRYSEIGFLALLTELLPEGL